MSDDSDQTASLMTPAKLAQLRAMKAKPAVSPAAWLDQMAADAGSGHVRRLVELRQQLEAQLQDVGYEGLVAAVKALGQSLQKLDFTLLQPKGWLARATGKGKEEAAGFVAQFERAGRAAEDLGDEVRALQRRQASLHAGLDRALVEFDVEARAIDKIIDQGARWLQDMRNQLKVRQAQAPDPAAQRLIDEDAARCELLVERLKKLRAANSAVHQVQDLLAQARQQREALLASLQQALQADLKIWNEQLAGPVQQARQGSAASGSLDDAKSAHQDLQLCLKQIGRDGLQMQQQETALASGLAAAREPLQAAA